MSDISLRHDSKIVLKLDLGDKGGVRRIRLNRLWEANEVSFQKLQELALELHTGTSKEVVFTYQDEDGDTITISSNEELSEAFLQFVEKVPPVLRANATFTTSNQEKKEQQGPPPEFILKIMDNINEALATAIDNFQKRTSKKESSNSSPMRNRSEENATPKQTNEDPGVAKPCTKEVDVDKKDAVKATALNKEIPVKEEPEKKEVKCTLTATKPKAPEPKAEEKNNSNSSAPNRVRRSHEGRNCDRSIVSTVPSHFDRKFIHGRHTCDACLTTPIIGIRYHAQNHPDYDLCQQCFSKSTDSNITFEPVQNERDVHLQYRWKRRQQRLARQTESLSLRGRCHRKEHVKTDEDDADLKEAIRQSLIMEEERKEIVQSDAIKEKNSAKNFTENDLKQEHDSDSKSSTQKSPTSLPKVVNSMSPGDIASIAACIAASLETSSKASDPQESKNKVKDVAVTDASAQCKLSGEEETSSKASDPQESKNEVKDLAVADASAHCKLSGEEEISSKASDPKESKNEVKDLAVADASAQSKLSGEENPKISTHDSDIFSSTKSVSTVEKEEAIVDKQAHDSGFLVRKDDIEITTMNIAMSDISTTELGHQAELLEEMETSYNKEKENDTILVNEEDCVQNSSNNETSFASDAEGQGEMALAIAETLDKCATEIDAIVAEVESLEDEENKQFEDYEKCNVGSFQSQDDDSASESGRTILDSVPTNHDETIQNNNMTESNSESDWQMLEDSQQIQDEMIARAAQLLGSALFSSTLNSEELSAAVVSENDSVPTQPDDSSFLTPGSSVASSISQSMKSAIPVYVLARWDKELKHLHEIGFLDDHKNIETLEKLEAANIGVDSKEYVTVEQAVNELLMLNEKKAIE